MYPTASVSTRCALVAGLLAGVLGLSIAPGCANKKGNAKPAASSSASAKPAAKPAKQADLSPKGFNVNHDDWAKVGYRLDWVGFPFVGEGQHPQVTMLEAYDDLIVIQDRQSTIAAVETGNGQTRWSTQLAGPLTKFVGITRDPLNPGHLIVSSESEAFVLSSANGNIMGRERFARVVNTPPVLMGSQAVFGTSTGQVLAHAMGRNVQSWAFASVGSIEANPILVGDYVAAVSQSGDVMFLSSAGGLVGRGRIYEGIDTNPVTDGGLLFIAGRDRSVWTFDPAGTLVWRCRTSTPLATQPTAHGGTLYVDIPGQGMTAFEETTGNVLWKSPKVSGVVIGTRGGKLLVNKGTTLMLVDASRGDIVESITVPGVVKIVLDKFDDGNIYAVNEKANVARFIPR